MESIRFTVFHINTERTFRGGEVQTLLLARELQLRGHNNRIFAPKESLLARRAINSGLATTELPMRGEWDLPSAWQIRKAIRDHAPNILHAHTPHACSLALLARMGHRMPRIVFSRRLSRPPQILFKFRWADAVLAVAPLIREKLIESGMDDSKTFVAESATDFSIFDQAPSRNESRQRLQIPPDAFVIGNVSHFDRHKGQQHLIETFAQFAARNPAAKARLLLVGEGPLLANCRSLAEGLQRIDRIIFTGQRLDLENLYAAMDLFFLSSMPEAFEGWSGVLREAMGFGLPVIAVRQEAIEEQVQHDESGLLVSPDRRGESVAAIELLYSDSQLREKLAAAGQKFARQFTPQALADKTEACYRAVLG